MQKWIVGLLVLTTLSGCATDDKGVDASEETAQQELTSVFERVDMAFNTTLGWSQPLVEGAFEILPSVSVFVDVPLPATEGGAAADPTNPPQAHLGLFLPKIDGCDWTQSDLPAQCNVPVIADVGPYYATPDQRNPSPLTEGDVPATERGSGRLGEFLISNFVPQGYAVAQVSVMGTGQSNHCFDMFGLAEQLGVHHAVEWLGTQSWSNGNVGLIGRSYDGSTPWMAAAHGSEHLKTIVPISGLSGLQDLVTWNGASESRILTFHNVIYGQYGIDGDTYDAHTACPDYATAAPWGAAAYATGDHVVEEDGAYWAERSFLPRVLENYQGSLYMIHGLQDDNVDPHAGWVAHQALVDAGFEAKAMYGQWQHMYPDRFSEHNNCGACPSLDSVRYDWAQDLLEWFDHYLMDSGPKPPLHVEVQQLDGAWRVEESLMPADAMVLELSLGTGTVMVDSLQGTTVPGFTVPGGTTVPDQEIAYHSINLGALSEEDVVLGGLSQLRLSVTPTSAGGQVFARLIDLDTGRDFGLSYAVAELRHAETNAEGVIPGQAMTITIPFQLFDAVLPGGHVLGLELGSVGNDYLPSPLASPVSIDLAGSHVLLSTLERGEESYFTPPVWYTLDENGELIE